MVESKKVLIAEDDPVFIDLLETRLDMEGFETEVVSDGDSLLEYVQNNPAPLSLILDIMMPKKSGIDTLIGIKEKWPDTRIYVFTAYPEYKDKMPVLKYYVDDIIAKNEVNKLMGIIRNIKEEKKSE